MSLSLDEAVGLLKCWQSADSTIFVMFTGESCALKTTGRVVEVTPLTVRLEWAEYGTLCLPLLGATFERAADSPKFASALTLTLRFGDTCTLFELLPNDDLFPDFIADA
jgi:hypothetical protein